MSYKAVIFFGLIISAFLSFLSSGKVEAQTSNLFASCEIEGDQLAVDLGKTRHPANFSIITPSSIVLQIVNPAEDIDALSGGYKKNTFHMNVQNATGFMLLEDGQKKAQRIFTESGEYQLVFKDANTAAGMELHQFKCNVSYKSDAVGIGKPYAITQDGAVALFPVGCNYSPGCGGSQYCCKKNSVSGPCYCSSCCVARPGAKPGETSVVCSSPVEKPTLQIGG